VKTLANLNRIILAGKLTADPDSRSTMDGLAMAKFRLAVARPNIGQGGTDFIDVVAWRKVAEDCGDKLRKGQLVLVEGRIQNRSYDDQTGKKRWVTEVVARNVVTLGKSSVAPAQAGESVEEDLSSDLPF
jgi:single-strand DNA-binding protein